MGGIKVEKYNIYGSLTGIGLPESLKMICFPGSNPGWSTRRAVI